MAWNVGDIMNFLKYQLRKNQAGGISGNDLFYAWNAEQSAFQTDLLGRWQKENNSKQGQNTGLIENETIMTKLAAFTQTVAIAITAGQSNKPSDFAYTLALRIGGYKVFPVNPDAIWAVNQDVIDPASITNNAYYYTEYQNYFSFLPATATTFQLDYIQVARDIAWGSTFDGAGRQIYDPGTSVQPVWAQADIIEITRRALNSFGVSLKDPDFASFGDKIIQTGNG